METRIELSEQALAAAEALAAESGRTLSEIVEEFLCHASSSGRADIYEDRRQKIERDIEEAVEEWRQRQPAR